MNRLFLRRIVIDRESLPPGGYLSSLPVAPYEEVEHVRIYRRFLNWPGDLLRTLLDGETPPD